MKLKERQYGPKNSKCLNVAPEASVPLMFLGVGFSKVVAKCWPNSAAIDVSHHLQWEQSYANIKHFGKSHLNLSLSTPGVLQDWLSGLNATDIHQSSHWPQWEFGISKLCSIGVNREA